jgi:cell division protein FtsB
LLENPFSLCIKFPRGKGGEIQMTNLQEEHAALQEEHLVARKRIEELEQQNAILKKRVADLEQGADNEPVFAGWCWE